MTVFTVSFFLVIWALTGGAAAAHAQCANPGRPLEDLLRSDVVYPQDRGEMQLELLPNFHHARDGRTMGFGFATQFGLSDSWQFQSDWDGPTRSSSPGTPGAWDLGSLELGTKVAFMCMGHSAWDLSTALDVELPIGTDEADGRVRLGPTIILARDFPAFHGHGFLSLILSTPLGHPSPTVLPSDASGTEYQWDVGVFTVVKHLRFTGELTLLHTGEGENEFSVTPGMVWNSPPWELAGGVFAGPRRDSPRGALFHIVYEFGGHGPD